MHNARTEKNISATNMSTYTYHILELDSKDSWIIYLVDYTIFFSNKKLNIYND